MLAKIDLFENGSNLLFHCDVLCRIRTWKLILSLDLCDFN